MGNLKSCPFCGCEAELTFSGRKYNDYWRGYIVAKCVVCKASSAGSFYYGPPLPEDIVLEETVGGLKETDNWNRRKGEESK